MTVTTVEAVRKPAVVPAGRASFKGLLASEWTKLCTVRSTMWTLGLIVVLGLGLSGLATAESRAHWANVAPGFDPTQTSLLGLAFAQLAVGVLGVLVMSAEYGTGTIRATLMATPRRWKVLLAKIAVFGAVALVVCEVISFAAFFLGQAILTAPATHATLSTPGALRQVVGAGLYLLVLGLLALGLATIIRHTAGALTTFVAILLILPLIAQALPGQLSLDIRRLLPDRIGSVLTSANPPNWALSPWVGFAVLCAYAVALLVIGGFLLVRRDA